MPSDRERQIADNNERRGPNPYITRMYEGMCDAASLVTEARIVWLEDVAAIDYVRASLEKTKQRKGKPRPPAGRVVGYAELDGNSKRRWPSDFFYRRIFWLKEHDRDSKPDGCYRAGAPVEAVDPATVSPKTPGILTARAWYGRRHKRIVAHPELAGLPVLEFDRLTKEKVAQ